MSKDREKERRSRTWNNALFGGYCCNDIFNCLYGTFFPACAMASAKSIFDGSDWCFNCMCFSPNPCLTRNYIRRGYGITGRIGISDCFTTGLCLPCVTVQVGLVSLVLKFGYLFVYYYCYFFYICLLLYILG